MRKKKKVALIVSIVVVILLALSLGFFFIAQTAFLEDDFIIREDFVDTSTGDYNQNWKAFIQKIQSGEKTGWDISGIDVDNLVSGDALSEYIPSYGGSTFSNSLFLVPAQAGSCSSGQGGRCEIRIADKKDYRGTDIKIRAAGQSVYVGGFRVHVSGNQPAIVEAKSSTINSDIVFIYKNGEQVGEVNLAGKPLNLEFASGLWLDFVKFNQLGCEIRDNEVSVFDDFMVGSSVTIDSLKYRPIHFCPTETQFQIRDFNTNRIVGDRGELLRKLVRGETIIVPQNQMYRISSITKFVEGQTPRCDIGFATNTKNGKCEQIIFQKETEQQLLQCKEVGDCFIPKNCGNVQVACQENKCVYNTDTCDKTQIINEIIVYKEILKEVEIPQINILPISAESQFTFTHKHDTPSSFNIGDFTFNSHTPEYTCGLPSRNGKVSIPNCYKVKVNNWEISNYGKIVFNKYLQTKYYFSGAGVAFQDGQYLGFRNPTDWVNVFVFTVDRSFIKFISNDIKKEYLHNSDCKIKLQLNNDWGNIKEITLESSYTPQLLKQSPQKFSDKKNIDGGLNNIELKIPCDQLGLTTGEIKYFTEIKADTINRIYSPEKLTFTYNVVSKLSKDSTLLAEQKVIQKERQGSPKVYIIIGIVIALIIIGLIILIIKRRRK